MPQQPDTGGRLDGSSVTVVGTNFAPESTGNAPYTTALARALAEAGARVRVVTGLPHYPEWKVSDPRFRIGDRWEEVLGAVRVTRVRHVVPQRPGLLGRGAFEATFLRRAVPVVREERSDLVVAVTPMLSGLVAAALSGAGVRAALVQDLTGNGASQTGSVGPWVGRLLARAEYALLRRSDRVGVITDRFARVLADEGIDPGRVDLLPNFSHVARPALSRDEARDLLGWDRTEHLVVHTGNMGRKQGLETVVEAARLVDRTGGRARFVLVGDGNQRAELEGLAAGVEALRFVPPVTAELYPLVLAAADVLLVNEKEGVLEMSLPSKLTSYAAAARPVVAAVEPGGITHSFLSERGAAVTVPAGRPAALVDAVERLAEDADRRAALAARIGELYDTVYSRTAAERRYVDFARRALDGAGHVPSSARTAVTA